MGQPLQGICSDWATTADLCSPCDDYTLNVGVMDEMLTVASEILWNLTGRQWHGSCQDRVRPCVRRIWQRASADDIPLGSNARPWVVCGCTTRCGCTGIDEITLGGYPLTSIVEIRIDGAVLSSDNYRIDDNRYLVRTDGEAWPTSQDMAADPASDDDTFEVTFTYGVDPPSGGVHAAAVLACELYKACQPEDLGECRLPKRVQTITRQGVTMAVVDSLDIIREGGTGIPEVDLWVTSVNPHGLRRRAGIASPDVGRRVRRAAT